MGGLARASTGNENVKATNIHLVSNCSFKNKNQDRVHVSCRTLMVSAFSKHFHISFHLLHSGKTSGADVLYDAESSFCGCFILFKERSFRLLA